MSYGLTAEGFVPKTYEVILDELHTALRDAFGDSINLTAKSALGQLAAIIAERFATLWELSEAVNASQDPDAATTAALDAVCALTGTLRLEATRSTVPGVLTGTPTTAVTAGSRASVESTGSLWETVEAVTIDTLNAWTATTSYAVSARVTNASRAYECITAGISAGAGGPTTTAEDITDNTVHWRYLGEGTGAVDGEFQSVETGPIAALEGDLNTIETPVGGWQSVKNLEDATLGRDEETDEALRIRRADELGASGTSTVDAIRAAVLEVEDVTFCRIFVNNEDTTDADGVPGHAIEVLVIGGEDLDIAEALLASVAAGIKTHGSSAETAVDSQGTGHTMEFSRPTEIPIHIILDVTKDVDTFPTDGADQIREAIVAWGQAQTTGKNAVASAISAQAFSVDGVLDVTSCLIGTAEPPVASTTIAIALRERATYASANIDINLVNGTP